MPLVPLADARNIYVARTYAYVSAGRQGLAIIDVEKPDAPKLDQLFNADGQLNDVNDVKIGMVAASAFAFVADGKNGLRVLEIVSRGMTPRTSPGSAPAFAEVDRDGRTLAARPYPSPKALIVTARWTNPATSWRCLADVAPGPSTKRKPGVCMFTAARATPTSSPTLR